MFKRLKMSIFAETFAEMYSISTSLVLYFHFSLLTNFFFFNFFNFHQNLLLPTSAADEGVTRYEMSKFQFRLQTLDGVKITFFLNKQMLLA